MRLQSRCACVLAAAGAAAPLVFAGSVQAQITTNVVCVRNALAGPAPAAGTANGPVPGLPAAQQNMANSAGVIISWASPQFGTQGLASNPVIDGFGNIAFYGQIASTSVLDPDTLAQTQIINTSNQNTVFWSSAAGGWSPSAVQIALRDGSAASPATSAAVGSTVALQGGPTPSNPNNWVLNSATGGNGIGANRISMAPNGRMYVGGTLNGAGATSTTNSAAFTGVPAVAGAPAGPAIAQAMVQGQAAPGTTLANFNTAAGGLNNFNQVNPSGQMMFQSTLVSGGAGTDVVTTGTGQNDSALFVMSPSGGSLVARRNAQPSFLSGAAFGAFSSNPGGNQINAAGDMIFTNTLSTTQGSVPATSSNNAVLCASVGGSLNLIGRSGTPVPVPVNGNTENFITSGQAFTLSGTNNSSGEPWNNNSRLAYTAKFAPSANITASVNDSALMTWQGGTTSLLYQAGVSSVPGVAGASTFSSVGGSNVAQNNLNHLAFAGTMNVGGPITSSNNQGLWFLADPANPATAIPIVQSGMVAPGSGGALFGSGFNGVVMNNNDTIIFQNTLSNTIAGLFAWNPSWGLVDLLLKGDTNVLGPNYPVSAFGYSLAGNGSGGVDSLNDLDQLALGVSSAATSGAIANNFAVVVMHVPTPGAGVLGMIGLVAMARRRRR
jgi:hypothetical protein